MPTFWSRVLASLKREVAVVSAFLKELQNVVVVMKKTIVLIVDNKRTMSTDCNTKKNYVY